MMLIGDSRPNFIGYILFLRSTEDVEQRWSEQVEAVRVRAYS